MRLVAIGALAILTSAQAIRSAMVSAYSDSAPDQAAKAWANHPSVLVSGALTEIGAATASAGGPPADALQSLKVAARLSPLAPEPFLARGIEAQQAGDGALARRSYLAARTRAPREAAPRFLLAEYYMARGDGARGLEELAVLARLLPDGAINVAPALARYAKTASDLRPLRAAFRANPSLEQTVLLELAKDPQNRQLILSMATSMKSPDGSVRDWAKTLTIRLVEIGEFQRARQVWSAAAGVAPGTGLFDPQFGGSRAPAPFNWTLLSDSKGFAEPDGTGGLHVVFYGREDALLATQTTVLGPGRYRLVMAVTGQALETLEWSVTCLPSGEPLQAVRLSGTAGTRSAEFAVHQNCPAQRFALKGSAQELPKEADVTIRGLTLSRLTDVR